MAAAASASSGQPRRTASESATSACVVSAPKVRPPPSSATPDRSGSRPMSTTAAGRATRSFIAGIRLCPPASNFASFPPPFRSRSRPTASASEPGRW